MRITAAEAIVVFSCLLMLPSCASDGNKNAREADSENVTERRVGDYVDLRLTILDASRTKRGDVHIKVEASWIEHEDSLMLDGIEHIYLKFFDSERNVVLKRHIMVALGVRFLDRIDSTNDVLDELIEVPASATFVELAMGHLTASSFIRANETERTVERSAE